MVPSRAVERVADPKAYVASSMYCLSKRCTPGIAPTPFGGYCASAGPLYGTGDTEDEAIKALASLTNNIREFIDAAEVSLAQNKNGSFVSRAGRFEVVRKTKGRALSDLAEIIIKNAEAL